MGATMHTKTYSVNAFVTENVPVYQRDLKVPPTRVCGCPSRCCAELFPCSSGQISINMEPAKWPAGWPGRGARKERKCPWSSHLHTCSAVWGHPATGTAGTARASDTASSRALISWHDCLWLHRPSSCFKSSLWSLYRFPGR
jgi:hypothetical protein